MKSTALLFLILNAVSASAQTRIFRWDDELCRYEGSFDAKKTTAAKLRNTLKLAGHSGFTLETNTIAWKFSDIAVLDVEAYDREYAKKSAELKNLDIVNLYYWEDLRKRKLRELEQVHRLNRTTMLAYREPKALMEYKAAPACTVKYANPLISGGNDLLRTWLIVNDASRKNNSDPDRIRRIYEQQLSSPERLMFAHLEVLNFGWSNCANDLIEYVNYDGSIDKEFRKLFRRVRTVRCDEP